MRGDGTLVLMDAGDGALRWLTFVAPGTEPAQAIADLGVDVDEVRKDGGQIFLVPAGRVV